MISTFIGRTYMQLWSGRGMQFVSRSCVVSSWFFRQEFLQCDFEDVGFVTVCSIVEECFELSQEFGVDGDAEFFAHGRVFSRKRRHLNFSLLYYQTVVI